MSLIRVAVAGAIATGSIVGAPALAQTPGVINPGLEGPAGAAPDGWTFRNSNASGDAYELRLDPEAAFAGATSARMESRAGTTPRPDGFALLNQSIDAAPFRGKRIRLRAAARNLGAGDGHMGLRLRVNVEPGRLGGVHEIMFDRPIRSTAWNIYEVEAVVPSVATTVDIGALFYGRASGSFDEFRLEIVGDAPDTTGADAFAAWLRESAATLSGMEMDLPTDDLARFSSMVGDARIVGLGEATHATREHFQLKNRMVRRLVEEQGFTAFAIEASYTDTRAINDWILGGDGDLNAVIGGMGFWIWNTQEVAELVTWLRVHNRSVPDDRKVRFYGFDMQPLLSPLLAATAYLNDAGLAVTGEDAVLIQSLTGEPDPFWQNLRAQATPEQLDRLQRVGDRLTALYDGHQEVLIAKKGAADFAAHRQLVTVYAQAVELVRSSRAGGTAYAFLRNRAMADNVDWILEQEGERGRVALWAHNAHVNEGLMMGEPTMGGELKRRHGDDYVSVGFFFGAGGFRAYGPTVDPNGPRPRSFIVGPTPDDSLDGVMTASEMSAFYFDVRAVNDDPRAWDWISQARAARFYGAVYDPAARGRPSYYLQLSDEYDVAVFTLATTPSRPLPTFPARVR